MLTVGIETTQEAERLDENPGVVCTEKRGPGHFVVEWPPSTHKLLVILKGRANTSPKLNS